MNLDLSLNKGSCSWDELNRYLNPDDANIVSIKQAYEFAFKAHTGQKRESGDSYICHPLWIAKVTAQLNLGSEAIIAALLHDVVEDTGVKIDEIARNFGDEIALLVEGLTEVKKKTKDFEVHETSISVFRHFLFSSVDDVRVLIIRIIDKLHNGLTIEALSEERQIKYAKRIYGIYGPVAEYVGLHYFKRLLEDIAFKILYPKEAYDLDKFLNDQRNKEKKAEVMIKLKINDMLKLNNINNFEIQSRIKSLSSTFNKVKFKGLDRVKDRVGIRVITDNVNDCYSVLGLLHAKYNYIPEEFDDYISSPKPNGYRSIQTTLKWKDGLTVEVQIRTKDMHDFNEFGPASHIAYKLRRFDTSGKGYDWVRDLVKWQRSDNNINNYRIKVLDKYVYVFSPKGDTIQLPKGSTALDYAYRIHSDLGDHCSVAKINGKVSKISDVLKTGDLVEIITTKKINVSRNWLDFVKTQAARDRIKKLTSE